MKRSVLFLIAAGIFNTFFFQGLAQAAELIPRHSFGIAPVVASFDYEEPGLMSEEGVMYGVLARYTYYDRDLMFHASMEYTTGDLDYEGGTWGGTPLTADTEDYILEFRALVGGNIGINENLLFPFMGVGYRYWNDDIQTSGGYEREIKYYYFPIGIQWNRSMSTNWTWGLSAEYDIFWKGQVKSHLSDAIPGLSDPTNDQEFLDGYGLRFSLLFKRVLFKNYTCSIEPYIRYWDVDESETAVVTYYGTPVLIVVEPANETMCYGLHLVFEY